MPERQHIPWLYIERSFAQSMLFTAFFLEFNVHRIIDLHILSSIYSTNDREIYRTKTAKRP